MSKYHEVPIKTRSTKTHHKSPFRSRVLPFKLSSTYSWNHWGLGGQKQISPLEIYIAIQISLPRPFWSVQKDDVIHPVPKDDGINPVQKDDVIQFSTKK